MTSIEETGKNIEEATQRALEQLGVTEDEVDVEILEEGAKGFLGLGQMPARVRVSAKAAPPAPPREPEEPVEVRPRRQRQRQPKPKPQPRPEPEPRPQPKPEPESKPQPKPESKARPRPARKPRPKPQPKPEPAVAQEIPSEPQLEPKPQAEPVPISSDDVLTQAAEISREALQRILDGIGVGGKVAVKGIEDGQVFLDMVDGDTAILIGKHGQTIDALQYLVGVITNRRLQERVRVVIDAEAYRGRREDVLRNRALYLAQKVKESGQEAVLEPLHPNERRIIHLALVDDPDITTYSEGDEPDRHVVISPKK